MPSLDSCHNQVVRALQNDGWTVAGTPRRISTAQRDIYIDMRAKRQSNGQGEQILLAEVKCFPERENFVQQVYTAIGQYIVYRAVLKQLRDTTPLYLVLPIAAYTKLDESIHLALENSAIKQIIVNLETEQIWRWIH